MLSSGRSVNISEIIMEDLGSWAFLNSLWPDTNTPVNLSSPVNLSLFLFHFLFFHPSFLPFFLFSYFVSLFVSSFFFLSFFLSPLNVHYTIIFLDNTTAKQGYALQAEPHVALILATVLVLCVIRSFSQICYFLCQNVTCEICMGIGIVGVQVQYLCEKWFCNKCKEKILT